MIDKKLLMCHDTGFTLIEVLVSIILLSSALIVVSQLQTVVIMSNRLSSLSTQGLSIAQDKLEELILLPYNDPTLSDNTSEGVFTTHDDPSPPRGYTVQWEVDANTPIPDNKTININVTCHNIKNAKVFSLSFVKSNL